MFRYHNTVPTTIKVFLYYLFLMQFMSSAEKYLVNTPGCRIQNYEMPIPDKIKIFSCGRRTIFVRKVNDDEIEFTFKSKLKKCCYKYIYTANLYGFISSDTVEYSTCEKFEHGSKVTLKSDFIFVQCSGYQDVYAFTKRIKPTNQTNTLRHKETHWNVLLLGLDRTSRTRAYNSLNSTVKYLQKEKWLDFRGYNKAGPNTYPNLVEVVTGLNVSTFEDSCHPTMTACNNLMIWSKFKEAGYITAYGEDSLYLPDTFHKKNGYTEPPTDHFMRPLFVASERQIYVTVCSKKIPSGEQILSYILDFVNTYRDKNFFGFFWISSFSHDSDHSLINYDSKLESFFKTLTSLKNTFVIFFSDHGMRHGAQTSYVESFYEDRLPMLFIRVPEDFKNAFPIYFSNLVTNQRRLTSPKDLHLTLINLFQSKDVIAKVSPRLDGCPHCRSLLQFISEDRTCSDIDLRVNYCACHNLIGTPIYDFGTMYSAIQLIVKIQDTARDAPTSKCENCAALKYEDLIRAHYYMHGNNTYYVIAFTMIPGFVAFEGIVRKNKDNDDYKYQILYPINSISSWRSRSACALNYSDRAFCVCVKDSSCRKQLFKKKTRTRYSKPPKPEQFRERTFEKKPDRKDKTNLMSNNDKVTNLINNALAEGFSKSQHYQDSGSSRDLMTSLNKIRASFGEM